MKAKVHLVVISVKYAVRRVMRCAVCGCGQFILARFYACAWVALHVALCLFFIVFVLLISRMAKRAESTWRRKGGSGSE